MLGTSAVTPAQRITADEQREAQQLGDHFVQRLRETRDLRLMSLMLNHGDRRGRYR